MTMTREPTSTTEDPEAGRPPGQRAGLPGAARPVGGADLADDDRGADHPPGLLQCRAGTWLAYGFGTVMLLFVVFCLNQFAKRSSGAGTMYAYTGRGLGPTAGVFSGWTLIWSYLFIAVAGMCGFAVFCEQLLDALGYHGSIHPILFFAMSAAGRVVHRLQGHPGLLDPHPGARGRLGGQHPRPGLHHLVQAQLRRRHGPDPTDGVQVHGMAPGRGGLHLLPGRLRERHRPRRGGQQPASGTFPRR